MKTDKFGNVIGDDSIEYNTLDLSSYGIKTSVQKSYSTESVYVYYTLGTISAVVRFSNHHCNAVEFGKYIDGNNYTEDEILFKLGLKERVFIPLTEKRIETMQVAKKKLANYEEAELTIKELYALEVGSDISKYTGKIAKGSNYLICSTEVELVKVMKRNSFGDPITVGRFEYK